MRKRGAQIKHRAKAPPGLVCITVDPRYETQLLSSVQAFRQGYAGTEHYLDMVDTHDLMRIALQIHGQPDASVTAALDLACVALENIRDRYDEKGRMGTTSSEFDALQLLADVCLNYWSRHSGALFHAAYREMVRVRRADYARVQAEREAAA